MKLFIPRTYCSDSKTIEVKLQNKYLTDDQFYMQHRESKAATTSNLQVTKHLIVELFRRRAKET